MQEASFNELQSEGYLCCSRHHPSVINLTINSQINYSQHKTVIDLTGLLFPTDPNAANNLTQWSHS
jgi:hypothetical protein